MGVTTIPRYDWTGVDPELIRLHSEGVKFKEIARTLNMDYNVLRGHARQIGLKKYSSIDWTDEIIEYVKTHYCDGARPIAEKFNIPMTAINKKASELGVKFKTKGCLSYEQ